MPTANATRRNATFPESHPEWRPADFDQMDEPTQEWAAQAAAALARYEQIADRDDCYLRELHLPLRARLRDTLRALAGCPSQFTPERFWLLAEVAEAAGEALLRDLGRHDTMPCSRSDLATPYYRIAAVWAEFCAVPKVIVTEQTHLESLRSLEALPGITESQICGILASGDRTKDEENWGPWILADDIIPIANSARLKAAREGKAEVPTVRTRKYRRPDWPAKRPYLSALAEAADSDG